MIHGNKIRYFIFLVMIELARNRGAIGAKVTGAGGGGSMVALCEEKTEPVMSALSNKGFKVLQVKL